DPALTPMYEQPGPLDGNGTNHLASLYFPPCIALILSHGPRDQCGIGVFPHWIQRRRTVAPVVVQPSLQERVELPGDIRQPDVCVLAKVWLPDVLPHRAGSKMKCNTVV